MRYFVLLCLLAGCVQAPTYGVFPPEKRAALLEAFELPRDPGPITVIVIAQDKAGNMNPKASAWAKSLKGTRQHQVESSEDLALHKCGLNKKDDETCFVVYKGRWLEGATGLAL